jgi:hypothetical protein
LNFSETSGVIGYTPTAGFAWTGGTDGYGIFARNNLTVFSPDSATHIHLGIGGSQGTTPVFEVHNAAGTSIMALGANGLDWTLDTTTGTKFGTATTQKLGFWNATPIVRPSAFTQTYATATKTHAALTSATLTDSTGGTANTTVQDVTAAFDQIILNNNFADIVAQVNALRVDLENAKQIINAVIDDGQSIGLLA